MEIFLKMFGSIRDSDGGLSSFRMDEYSQVIQWFDVQLLQQVSQLVKKTPALSEKENTCSSPLQSKIAFHQVEGVR